MKGIRKYAVLQAACLLITAGAGMLPAEPVTVLAADKVISGEYGGMTYEDFGTRCRINGYTAALPEDLVIPDEIDGMKVEWIGEGAFSGCTKLKSVTIPKTVGYVLAGSFANCTALETVTFSERTERVHFSDNAFAGTKWFAAQKAQNPLVIADRSVLDGKTCSGAVTIPDGVEEIVFGAFAENTALTGITLPDSLNAIGKEAFRGSGLKKIVIPGSVETVDNKAFQSCTGLTSAVFGEGVKTVETYSFEGCRSLKTVSFPQSLKEIKLFAFSKCAALESVELPEKVRSVGASAFTDCTALKEVICRNYYTVMAGGRPPAGASYDNGVTISNSGEFSKKFTYSGVMRGYTGSFASKYANELGIRFESLGEPPVTGKCAEQMVWAFEGDTLYIQGTGVMDSYFGYRTGYSGEDRPENYLDVAPWFMFRDQIKHVIVGAYVNQIASGAFSDLSVLESAEFQNPNCLIPYGKSTVSNGLDTEGMRVYNGVIIGFSTSTAKEYAEYSGYRFQPLDMQPAVTTAVTTAAATTTAPVTTAAVTTTAVTTSAKPAVTVPVTTAAVSATVKPVTTVTVPVATAPVSAQTTVLTVPVSAYQRGDVTGDGDVSIEDAQIVLKEYTECLSGRKPTFTGKQKTAADIDGSGTVSVEDAQLILKYYTENTVAGKHVTWEELMK